MNFSCDKAITCPGSDFPISNFSSEAPDKEIFIGVNYGWDNNIPPLNKIWATPGCVSWCITNTSQEDADLCAARQEIICQHGGGDPGPIPPPGPGGDGSSDPSIGPNVGPQLFSNDAQSCSVTCPDGSVFTTTVAVGEVIATTLIQSNNIAASLCHKRALANRLCIAEFDGFSCADPTNTEPELFHQLTASVPIASWILVGGAIPPGWTLETNGILHGFPDTAGTFAFTVQATSTTGTVNTKAMTMNVVGITTQLLDVPTGFLGIQYTFQIKGLGGTEFSITAGSLPAGLSMDEFGFITGIPTEVVTNQLFTVTLDDEFGHSCSQEFIMDIAINASMSICRWDTVLGQLTPTGVCTPSSNPAWDGVFNIQTNSNDGLLFYFINKSILGGAVAASDATNWPNGDWRNQDTFAQLYWSGAQWVLDLSCANGDVILLAIGTSIDPTNPEGLYNTFFGTPDKVTIVNTLIHECPNDTCPDWTQLFWDDPLLLHTGDGTATFAPILSASDSWTAFANTTGATIANTAQVANTGLIQYKGPGCNCNLHMVAVWRADVHPENSTISVVIDFNNGTFILNQAVTASGTFDFPFSVPDTFGATVPISVTIADTCRDFIHGPGPLHADQTSKITNIP